MKILVVDGNSIINRAYFGVRPLTNPKGQRTEAIYGMTNIILAQTEKYAFDCVFVAFDLPAPTFRHKMYEGYKGNRKGMEEELFCQMAPAKELLKALGYRILEKEGYEADDFLGTVSRLTEERGGECFILTGDRDSLQLISDKTKVLLVTKGETVCYDEEKFKEKYGILPTQFVDAKALMGDSSDCIPGVPGIGEKTALPLIARFGSLEGVYAHLEDSFIKAGVRTKLSEFRESANLSKTLSEICRQVPIAPDFSEEKQSGGLYDLLKELGFSSLIARLHVQPEELLPKEAPKADYTEASLAVLQEERGEVAVVLGEDCLYISSQKGNFRIPDPTPAELGFFFSPERSAVVQDCKSFYRWLALRGITDFEAKDDPMLMAYVLSSTDNDYRLSALVGKYLEKQLPAGEPGASCLCALRDVLEKRLKEQGSLHLYQDLELPTAGVLARCEEAGFLVDKKGIADFGNTLLLQMQSEEEEIYRLAGKKLNLNSPKQLGTLLFEELKLTAPGIRKTKSGYSTNAETLEKLRGTDPIISLILDYRQLSKLRSTYTEGLLKVADEKGRVHTTFTQTVTATGRLSSVEPNLQNIPVRTELGRELRRFFVAPQGKKLIDADYSQIELRLLACISGDQNMINAFQNGVDIHTVTASQVFGVPPEAVTPEMRKSAKAVNFGIVYGISAFSLSEDLGVTRAEADDYIKSYFRTYPGIERYLSETVERAKREGYVTTLSGRRRSIPELTSGKGMLKKFGERVAMNSPIQGTAADIIKKAMIRVDRALQKAALDARLILQVHDELIVECSKKDVSAAAEILRREMEGVMQLAVPLTVELNIGDSWYECK
ncbi:MAG TPA: DNA polymerase I [Clostridiales bacterium]|nr:DNA polymerase I [Clostridiales bacterium]